MLELPGVAGVAARRRGQASDIHFMCDVVEAPPPLGVVEGVAVEVCKLSGRQFEGLRERTHCTPLVGGSSCERRQALQRSFGETRAIPE